MKPYLRKTVSGILDWWSVISPPPFLLTLSLLPPIQFPVLKHGQVGRTLQGPRMSTDTSSSVPARDLYREPGMHGLD